MNAIRIQRNKLDGIKVHVIIEGYKGTNYIIKSVRINKYEIIASSNPLSDLFNVAYDLLKTSFEELIKNLKGVN